MYKPLSSSSKLAALSWPGPLARMEPQKRMLTLALGISLLFHIVLLSVHFKLPQAIASASEHALEIILVNSKSERRPTQAQAKAQNNLDGGGNTEQDVRASTPLPPSKSSRDGDNLVDMQRRAAELQAQQQQLLAQAKSKYSTRSDRNPKQSSHQASGSVSGLDLVSNSLAAIRKIEGEIARSESTANKHPMRKVLAVRAVAAPEAMYVDAVLQKIERVGTLNFPAAARGQAYGQLMATLVINPDGSLRNFELERPADAKVLNAAARKIAEMAAPFPRVPAQVLGGMEVVSITRWWSFTNEDFKTRSPK